MTKTLTYGIRTILESRLFSIPRWRGWLRFLSLSLSLSLSLFACFPLGCAKSKLLGIIGVSDFRDIELLLWEERAQKIISHHLHAVYGIAKKKKNSILCWTRRPHLHRNPPQQKANTQKQVYTNLRGGRYKRSTTMDQSAVCLNMPPRRAASVNTTRTLVRDARVCVCVLRPTGAKIKLATFSSGGSFRAPRGMLRSIVHR